MKTTALSLLVRARACTRSTFRYSPRVETKTWSRAGYVLVQEVIVTPAYLGTDWQRTSCRSHHDRLTTTLADDNSNDWTNGTHMRQHNVHADAEQEKAFAYYSTRVPSGCQDACLKPTTPGTNKAIGARTAPFSVIMLPYLTTC